MSISAYRFISVLVTPTTREKLDNIRMELIDRFGFHLSQSSNYLQLHLGSFESRAVRHYQN